MIWFFHRNGERLRYEIRRAPADDRYELALTLPDGHTQTEEAADGAELLEKCAAMAGILKAEGWRASHLPDDTAQ